MSADPDAAPIKLLYILTVATTARNFLQGQLREMAKAGYAVTVICTPEDGLEAFFAEQGAAYIPVTMAREISPLSDLVSLFRLYGVLRRERPQIVNVSTPKAGLLGGIAAWLARTPARIYLLRGLRLETATGIQRIILEAMERLASACAHVVICNSESLRARYLELKLGPPHKAVVLGAGTSNGIAMDRFAASEELAAQVAALRERYSLAADTPTIGFVGRLVRDKGIDDLVTAFGDVQKVVSGARLLLVGDYEPGDPVSDATKRAIDQSDSIIKTGFVSRVAPYLALMQVFAFPSYREGLPNAPLEAAACGVPAVGYDATGTRDAIVDGKTGILVPVGAVGPLADALMLLLTNDTVRVELGNSARERVFREYSPHVVWQNWIALYRSLLTANLKSGPGREAR